MVLIHKILAFWFSRIVFFIVLVVVYSFVGYLLFESSLDNDVATDEIAFSYLVCVILIASSFTCEALRKSGKWYHLGFDLHKQTNKELVSGIVCAGLSLAFIGLIAIICGTSLSLCVPGLSGTRDLITTCIVVSLIEEILFRGVIFQALLERFGQVLSTLAISILFGLAHYFNPNLTLLSVINIVLAGICLSVMYIRTKSLWMPIAFHFMWNFSQEYFLGSAVSGVHIGERLFTFDWEFVNKNFSFLFGGDFGIEGGILTTIVLIVSTVYTLRYLSPSPYITASLFKRKFAENALLYNDIHNEKTRA